MNRLLGFCLSTLSLYSIRSTYTMDVNLEPPFKRQRTTALSSVIVNNQVPQISLSSTQFFDRSRASHVLDLFFCNGLIQKEGAINKLLESLSKNDPSDSHTIQLRQNKRCLMDDFANHTIPWLDKKMLQTLFCRYVLQTLVSANPVQPAIFPTDYGILSDLICTSYEDYGYLIYVIDTYLTQQTHDDIVKKELIQRARNIINLCLSNGKSTLNSLADQNKDHLFVKVLQKISKTNSLLPYLSLRDILNLRQTCRALNNPQIWDHERTIVVYYRENSNPQQQFKILKSVEALNPMRVK